MTVSLQQPMRPAEIELVAQVNKNESAINAEMTARNTAVNAVAKEAATATNEVSQLSKQFPITTASIADNAITAAKLAAALQEQLTFLRSIPMLTYGESESTSVPANSNVLMDVTFPNALTEAPNVYCMARSTVCVECNVEQVTNQQVSIRLYNNTTSDADSVSIDWLAISGR